MLLFGLFWLVSFFIILDLLKSDFFKESFVLYIGFSLFYRQLSKRTITEHYFEIFIFLFWELVEMSHLLCEEVNLLLLDVDESCHSNFPRCDFRRLGYSQVWLAELRYRSFLLNNLICLVFWFCNRHFCFLNFEIYLFLMLPIRLNMGKWAWTKKAGC